MPASSSSTIHFALIYEIAERMVYFSISVFESIQIYIKGRIWKKLSKAMLIYMGKRERPNERSEIKCRLIKSEEGVKFLYIYKLIINDLFLTKLSN